MSGVLGGLDVGKSVASLEALTEGTGIEEAIVPLEAYPHLFNSSPMMKRYEVVVSALPPSDQNG